MFRQCVSREMTQRRVALLATLVAAIVILGFYFTRVDLAQIRHISFEEVSQIIDHVVQ